MNWIVMAPVCRRTGEAGQAQRRRFGSSLLTLFLAAFFFQLGSASAAAQTISSTIEGTVTDEKGAVIVGAEIKASGATLASERSATTDGKGFYRLATLTAGTYTLKVSHAGFATRASTLELTLNRVVTFDVQLRVAGVTEEVSISSDATSLLERNAASTGSTILPRQIQDLPVNGRDYLGLLQLVPGVAINAQEDPDGDNATPALGERSGNNSYLIDGHPNKDTVNGGPAAQFNQETIAEFQVLTTGYKAEFGQASGAVVNVITKSGSNAFHGVGSLFHRNDAFDSSNSLDPAKTDPPRWKDLTTVWRQAGGWFETRFSSSHQQSGSRRTADRIFCSRIPEVRWSISCCMTKRTGSIIRTAPSRRGPF